MEDINARIIVAVESKNAEQSINRVKKGVSDVTDARMRDLQITQAKAKLEQAKYNSMIAAQKAYNAELQIESLQKLKAIYARKKDAAGVDQVTAAIERNRGKLLELTVASTNANLKAYESKVAYENLLMPIDKNIKSTDKLTKNKIALRTASRLLRMDLGEGNAAMFKAGIIAAGAAASLKLLKFGYEKILEPERENIRVLDDYSKSIQDVGNRLERHNQQVLRDAEIIGEYGGRQDLTAKQAFALTRAVERQTEAFKRLGIEVKGANGAIADGEMMQAKLEAEANKSTIDQLKKEYKTVVEQIAARRKAFEKTVIPLRSTTELRYGISTPDSYKGDITISGAEQRKINEEIAKLEEKRIKLNEKMNDLRRKDPVGDLIRRRNEFDIKFANDAMNKRLKDLEIERTIQQTIFDGRKREAEILKIRNQLDKEALKLRGKELEVFNKRRPELEKSMLQSYDQRAAQEQQKENERAAKEQQRLAERAAREQLRIEERAARNRKEVYREMSKELFKFKETTQGAVFADSLQGVKLQSRVFLNTTAPQNDPGKGIVDLRKEIKDIGRNMQNLLRNIVTNTAGMKNIQTKRY